MKFPFGMVYFQGFRECISTEAGFVQQHFRKISGMLWNAWNSWVFESTFLTTASLPWRRILLHAWEKSVLQATPVVEKMTGHAHFLAGSMNAWFSTPNWLKFFMTQVVPFKSSMKLKCSPCKKGSWSVFPAPKTWRMCFLLASRSQRRSNFPKIWVNLVIYMELLSMMIHDVHGDIMSTGLQEGLGCNWGSPRANGDVRGPETDWCWLMNFKLLWNCDTTRQKCVVCWWEWYGI